MKPKQEQQSGIVLLFDLVGHSKQSEDLGNTICGEALNIFFSKIKEISSTRFTWVKDSDDAGLFIGNDPKEAVDFYQKVLRQFPADGKTVHRGFTIKFRLVAHFCPFTVAYNPDGQLTDISGSPINFLFKKVEKEANAGQMVVSKIFYDFYHQELESEGFGFTPFTAEDRETELYLLVLPALPKKTTSSKPDIKPLFDKMNKLKRDVQKIKTPGGIYPDLNMENQFVKLRLTALKKEELYREERDVIDFQHDVKKKSPKGEEEQLLECDKVYENYPRLLIKGILGVGKTTILKYFCFKGFASDRYPLFIPCLKFPNITQWEREYSYVSKGNITWFMVHLTLFAFLYPNKTYNEISEVEKKGFAETIREVTQWVEDGKLIFCLDALDEVADTTQQKEILRLVTLWFKKVDYHIYLTARDHTFSRISEDIPLASVNPLQLDQFQDLGEKFFKGDERRLKKFREESWQQEIVVSVASTPLLATLVLVWFENKGEFARRPTLLHFITSFILLKMWDKLKNPDYQKSIEEIFRLTLDPEALEKDEELSLSINALEELVWNAVMAYEKGVVSQFKEEAIIAILNNLFIKKTSFNISAQKLLDDLTNNYFLLKIAQAPNYYTFIHHSILEFLATRRMENLEESRFLFYFHEFMGKEKLFPLEILPLFCALSFENLKKAISGLNKYDQDMNPLLRDGMAFRILVEAEGFIREQTDDDRNRLIIEEHKLLLDDFKAIKNRFMARFASYLGTDDPNKLKGYSRLFNATGRFQDKELVNRLNYSLFEGEDSIVRARDTLLEQMVHFRLIEEWKTGQRNLRQEEREKKVISATIKLNVDNRPHHFDSMGYDEEDKNFGYYSALIPELAGVFGSPNLRHSGPVNKAVFSPDGRYILSASNDDTLKLWDKETGKEVRTFKGHSSWVRSGVFSEDGRYILSASYDNTLKLWDKETGKEVRTFKGHSSSVRSGVFSKDGRYILSASGDNTLKLWDKETEKCLKTINLPWTANKITIHPTEKDTFLTANGNCTLSLFELKEW